MKRHYFITGTSRGIGKALALKLLDIEGTSVTGISRTKSIEAPNYSHVNVDLKDISGLIEKIDQIFQSNEGCQDIGLINNAGLLGEIGYLGEINPEDYKDVLTVNTIAPVVMINEYIRRFQDSPVGKVIINISSGAAVKSYDGWGPYCSSKAAVNMLTMVVAKEQEIRATGVKVFAVEPGVVETEMQSSVRKATPNQFSKVQKFIDLKENNILFTPEESAERLLRIINNPEKFDDIILDVREL